MTHVNHTYDRHLQQLESDIYQLKREIAFRKQVESELIRTNIARTELFEALVDEISTPSAEINGCSKKLNRDLSVCEREVLCLQMRNHLDRFSILLEQVKDLSQAESGKPTLDLKRIHTLIAVKESCRLLSERAARHDRRFNCQFQTPVPESIFIDRRRFINILQNLADLQLSNCDGLEMQISFEKNRLTKRLIFKIQAINSGETKQALQSPMIQGGLGLVVSQRLAASMNGNVEIVSDKTGTVAAVFSLEISSPKDNLIEVPNPQAETPPSSLSSQRVLLVEHTLTNQRRAIQILESEGAMVDISANGQEAVDKATRATGTTGSYDLIIVNMGHFLAEGYKTVVTLRRLGLEETIIGFAVDNPTDAVAAGCDYAICGSLERETLFDTIRSGPDESTTQEDAISPYLSKLVWDSEFKGLLKEYLDSLIETGRQMERAVMDSDFNALSRECHRLKGNGATFGLNCISKAADCCEIAIRKGGSAASIKHSAERLFAVIKQVQADNLAALRGNGSSETATNFLQTAV